MSADPILELADRLHSLADDSKASNHRLSARISNLEFKLMDKFGNSRLDIVERKLEELEQRTEVDVAAATEGGGYRVDLANGATHYVDADDHSMEYATKYAEDLSHTVHTPTSGTEVVRFWKRGTTNKRDLVAVIPLEQIVFLKRA